MNSPLPPTHSPFGCMQTPTGLPLVSFLYCSSGKYSHSQAGSATGWVDGGEGAYSWGSTSDAGSTLTRYNDTLIHPFTEKPACRDICLSATYTALSMWYEERQQMGIEKTFPLTHGVAHCVFLINWKSLTGLISEVYYKESRQTFFLGKCAKFECECFLTMWIYVLKGRDLNHVLLEKSKT